MKKVTFLLVAIMTVAMSFETSAQSVDSVRISYLDVVGLNPSTQIRIGFEFFGVSPSGVYRIVYQDLNGGYFSTINFPPVLGTGTASCVISGLAPNTFYSFKVVFSLPIFIESLAVGHTTAACPFVVDFTVTPDNNCESTLVGDPNGGQCYWVFGGTLFSTAPAVKVNASGDYTLTVNLGGCYSSATKNVVIPGIAVTAIVDKPTICFGELIKLNAAIANPTGFETFTWTSDPIGFTSSQQNPTAKPNVNTSYFLTVSEGSCSNTSTVNVTVNKNNSNVTMYFPYDSICNRGSKVNRGVGNPANGDFSGEFMIQNYFIPDTNFVGPSEVTYTVTDNNGCKASAVKTMWVIDSPVIDTMYYIGKTFEIDGWFPYDITVSKNGVIYPPSDKSDSKALFNNMDVNEGDGITVRSFVGGCFAIKEFHRFGLGIEDQKISFIKQGDLINLYDISGIKITSILSPKDFQFAEFYQVEKLFGNLPARLYLWHSGKEVRKFIRQ